MTEPRRIAYLGNFAHPWCTEVHVAGSLRSLGHTVSELQENRTDWAGIPEQLDRVGAHMLLWTRTWPADMEQVRPVLDELAARGIPTVSYHLDRWFGLNREHQVDDQPFFHTRLVVSPDDSPRWAEHGVEHLWMPPGVYHAECDPARANPRRWPFDVVFVGSFPYPHEEWSTYRSDLIARFAATFGDRFTVLPRKGQPIRGRALQELYATVPVVLGDSCLAGESHRYWSDRIPETLGRGGLLIHPEVDTDIGPAGEWYQGVELGRDLEVPSYEAVPDLLTYPRGDFDTAVTQARAALEFPNVREIVARHGRETVTGRDTYRHRMDQLLSIVAERFGWRDAPEPTPTTARAPRRQTQRRPRPERTSTPAGRVSARCGPRWRGIFDPRPGSTDQSVIDECWTSNDYRVPTHGMTGTVLDVGANVGAFSVLAAKAGAQRVIAVEPHPDNRDRLLHHVELNQVGQIVTVDGRAAVGGAWAGDMLVMVGEGGGAHEVAAPEGSLAEDAHAVAVPTVPLAELILEHAPLAFVKVDIEGGEYDALLGVTAHLLHEHVAALALEFHGPVMPHLAHLDDGLHLQRWGQLVALLADCGRVEIFGHPTAGGLIWWKRY